MSGVVPGAGVARLECVSLALEPSEWAACCASQTWVAAMVAGQPYPDLDTLLRTARETWADATPADVREAVAAHPRIGARTGAGTQESREQAGTADAADDVLAAIAVGNRDYEQRFGMTYLVRAAGRSADELLDLLRERLAHDPETELAVAARQQAEITDLRLRARVTA